MHIIANMFVVILRLLKKCVYTLINFLPLKNMLFSSVSSKSLNTTIVDEEIEHFNKLCDIWWNGMHGLHALNKMRVPLIVNGLKSMNKLSEDSIHEGNSLKGIRILDAGCGGGILTEALATCGADTIGLDASLNLIKCAQHHAEMNLGSIHNISYIHNTIEDFSANKHELFDAVVSSEVVEHIDLVDMFLEHCIKVLKPGGSLFLTTINRTMKSWLISIVLREYIWRNIPMGTHQWHRFISPDELKQIVEKYNCDIHSIHGWRFDNFSHKWIPSEDLSVSYGMHVVKRKN